MLTVLLALLLWSDADQAHKQGLDLYNQHKYNEAIAALQGSAQREKPGSAEYIESITRIGQSYFMLSQAPKAIPWLEKAPSSNEVNYMLGYAYLQAGDQGKSVEAFARLFKVASTTAAAHLLAGQMMLKKEYEEQATAEVKRALEIDPNIPEAHFLLAEMEIYRGNLEAAIADLMKELAANPNFAMAWYRLGDAYTRQENWPSAIENLQRAVWLNPNFSGPYILLGKSYFKTRDFSNAEGILRRALQLDPQNYSATYLLGQTLMALGRADEGRTLLQKSRTLPRE